MVYSLGEVEWSHDRELNPRPHPYHGCALPTELSRHQQNNNNKFGAGDRTRTYTPVRDLIYSQASQPVAQLQHII